MSQTVTTADGTEHVFPDEASPSQIRQALLASAKPPAPAAAPLTPRDVRTAAANTPVPMVGPFGAMVAPGLTSMLNAAPGVLGAVGGLAGGGEGPLAVGGATAGGAVGGALKQGTEGALGIGPDLTPGQRLLGVGADAATQGGLQLAGGVLAKGAGKLAGPLMKRAIGEPLAMAKETANKALQPVEETALATGTPVGKMLGVGPSGSEQAQHLVNASGKALELVLKKAGDAGVRFDVHDIAGPAISVMEDAAKYPLTRAQKTDVLNMTEEFLSNHPDQVTPQGLKDLKANFQKLASRIYRAQGAGTHVPAAAELEARFNEAIASTARQKLMGAGADAATQHLLGPVGAIERNTQSMMRMRDAVRNAELRAGRSSGGLLPVAAMAGGAAIPGHSVPGALGSYALARMLMSPEVGSRAALALNNPAVQDALGQAPRGLASLVQQASTEGPTQ